MASSESERIYQIPITRREDEDLYKELEEILEGNHITMVWKVHNPAITERYEAAMEKEKRAGNYLRTRTTMHGTSENVIPLICQQGFKVGGVDIPLKHGSAYGTGIYTSETSFARSYAVNNKVIICRVAVTKDCHRSDSWESRVRIIVQPNKYLVEPLYVVLY